MPPWSNRLLSPNSRNQANTTPPTHLPLGIASGATPVDSRLPQPSESDILEHAFGIPALPSHPQSKHGASATSKSSRTPSSSHGRSMSHPFPSIFNSKNQGKNKKRDGGVVAGVGGAALDSTTDDETLSLVKSGSMGAVKSKEKVSDKDLRTGNCMTCDSMVRWPKDLKVFRCSVCLTINDLVSVKLEARHGDGHRVPPVTGPGGLVMRVPPISVAKTNQLIDRCITNYLLARLGHEDATYSNFTSQRFEMPEDHHLRTSRTLPVSADPRSHHHLSPSPTRPVHHPDRSYGNRRAEGLPIRKQRSFNDINQTPSTCLSPSSSGYGASHVEPSQFMSQGHLNTHRNGRRSGDGREASAETDRNVASKHIFKPVEEYIITCFGSYECVNSSFSSVRPSPSSRAASEGNGNHVLSSPSLRSQIARAEAQLSEMDAKTLLVGDFAENGFWWTGENADTKLSPDRTRKIRNDGSSAADFVTVKSPRIDWVSLGDWYTMVINSARSWRRRLDEIVIRESFDTQHVAQLYLEDIDDKFLEAQERIQRVLLKATEGLLKRPSRPLSEPGDLRFLLILLANPLLYSSQFSPPLRPRSRSISKSMDNRLNLPAKHSTSGRRTASPSMQKGANADKGSSGQHSGIIKRILGLLSNVSNECHHHLVSWFARYSDSQFQKLADLIGSFVTYRLTRQHGKKRDVEHDPTADLVPSMGNRRGDNTSAALHAALGSGSAQSHSSKKAEKKEQPVVYDDDWQIKAAARVMSLVVSANDSGIVRRGDKTHRKADEAHSAGLAARDRAHRNGQILATSDFYNTLLDYSNLIADFEAWESKKSKFAFCQYPFFLSIWAKIKIMEHDAHRQMEVKAREAFFDSIMTRKTVNQYLVLRVRRDCLVEDSLKGVSEVMGTGGEEIKKGLRIEFKGEEGIDAGGLRKEWFLLLVRDVFNPEHGMFIYDDDSQFCYFNPNSFETSDQFFLVGVVLGLAIYNSTILDVALPPFAFRKLLAAAPAPAAGSSTHSKTTMTYTLDDLAEYKPMLANGLRQLLDFEGDVESVYCRDFVADVERFGELAQVPLCAGGEKRAVTNANRREFVDVYVRYLLDTAVIRQFEPFKRGFFAVCGGNALSLFRAEEIELLIRGSEEPLDIASLRAVSKVENWGVQNADETEPVIQWFWDSFENADPRDQRKLLGFVTGSDRIPAMGATNLIIKLSCLGDDGPRFPIARTCFNQLSLWRYSSRAKLEDKLWTAVHESEGFGLK